MTTYAIPGLTYDDGSPVTFEANDPAATELDFRRLLGLAGGCARDRAPSSEDPFHENWLHGWALEFARDKFTNFGELAGPLICDADHEPYLCEPCTEVRRIARETDEDQSYGLLAQCQACLENANVLDERLRLLELGVAAWVKCRWPDLAIDGERWCHGTGFSRDELSVAVRGLTPQGATEAAS